ncbi:hypothetical protein FCULG_00008797 [Fusarium culmorum]|uniref:Uncharacterized protein n=1 Tax=Fusarium culmorum TaxID=5516 RepID=A0A2T4H095_FUSCU|nr:hypothetical protein FCULG_00008797 [Fusarium culmorum]
MPMLCRRTKISMRGDPAWGTEQANHRQQTNWPNLVRPHPTEVIHTLAHQDSLACKPCFQGMSHTQTQHQAQQRWCSPWKQDSEPLMLGRFGSSVICLCLSKAIDVWNEGPSAFKYDLDPYTMYSLLPSQHLPSWNHHHLPVEDLFCLT